MLNSLSPYSNINPTYTRPAPGGLNESQALVPGETDPAVNNRQSPEKSFNNPTTKTDSVQISAEAQEISQLTTRDREVRTHEAAHAAVGGAYAGAPSLTYKKGPDGRSYATGGEVSIDVSPVSGDPQATLMKAEIVRSAALAPAQPSAQDMRVASRAAAMAAKARGDLVNAAGVNMADEGKVEELAPKGETEAVEPTADVNLSGQ